MNQDKLKLGAEFQPLIQPKSLSLFGYEALSRFYNANGKSIAPNLVFEQLHQQDEWLAAVEWAAKSLQIKYAPKGFALFVNIDPHAVENNSHRMINLLKSHPNLCVEIIENTCINDAKLSDSFINLLIKEQIDVALDDVGAPHSMLSIELMSKVNCIKFDKHWLKMANKPEYHFLLSSLVGFAQKTHKLTILEGIETQQQLDFARKINVDLVQGYLFRPQFIHIPGQTNIDALLQTQLLA